MTSNKNKDLETSASINNSGVEFISSCVLPTPWAIFHLHAFFEAATGKEHLALTLGDVATGAPVLARLHSECLTGDALFSQRCDCGAQLETALKKIAHEGCGVLLYLRQEGRGIGLLNKVHAYRLQDAGADTVEANQALGFAPDMRNYQICQPMLQHLQVKAVKLMSNNPRKAAALQECGIQVTEQIPLIIKKNPHNERYLLTKAAKLGHVF
ncbi:GTP cyclohydrolase II [Solimicrobium silvestre]|uniref:GTP cyclohydrolase-2 n=1 Tax=Solimicrobium silvestre TaxID=2099400 RepID=A0A2S9GV02_9BURK|nr:GTP cyclohydrolase II [Solimicrobium silvestre]PRC91540.1 ribA: GTP cyclohydrolase II [Solimicrobium silvestre]